jgi:SAM-dependent methyltransferase
VRLQLDRLPDRAIPRLPAPTRGVVFRYVDWRDRRRPGHGLAAVPPARLRFRVHGEVELQSFVETGKQCRDDVLRALGHVDRDLGSFGDVLDFGCGCGRTLLWFAGWAERSRLHGTDIDEEATSWCRRSIDFVQFTMNRESPPLPYADHAFDFVYAISVFTHLSEELQFSWLADLRRIIKPDGYLLVTVRGSYYLERLTSDEAQALAHTGFVYSRLPDYMQRIFPPWYQIATHSETYVRERYSEYFEVARYIPRGMDGCQDVVLLRRV